MTRLAINGFGRIGRNVIRAARKMDADFLDLVAVNDLTDARTLGHLLTYDSVHGRFSGTVEVGDDSLTINGKAVRVLAEKDPGQLPWQDLGVDIVLESTGRFTDRPSAARHLDAGARKVIISAPGKQEDLTVVYGVNHDAYDDARHHVISNASCTTNCLAPVVKVLHERLGVVRAFMTTVHAYTNDQRILDLPHKDLRRARAAALSIIPTTTGAARATALVLPELKGRIDGVALRVPTADVSVVELACEVGRETTVEEVNGYLQAAADGPLAGVLAVSNEPLVSIDYVGALASSTVDALSTSVVGGRLVHVTSWYDNEMGYSARCVDLIRHLGERLA